MTKYVKKTDGYTGHGTPIGNQLKTSPPPPRGPRTNTDNGKFKMRKTGETKRVQITRVPTDGSTRTMPRRKATNRKKLKEESELLITPPPPKKKKNTDPLAFTETPVTPVKQYTPSNVGWMSDREIRQRIYMGLPVPPPPRGTTTPLTPIRSPQDRRVSTKLPRNELSPGRYGTGAFYKDRLQTATELNKRLPEARKLVKTQQQVNAEIAKKNNTKPTGGKGGGGGRRPRDDAPFNSSSPRLKVVGKNKRGQTVDLRNLYASPRVYRLQTYESKYLKK